MSAFERRMVRHNLTAIRAAGVSAAVRVAELRATGYPRVAAGLAKARLEQLRRELRAERISYMGLAELADLADEIQPGDVELAEPAGIPENEFAKR